MTQITRRMVLRNSLAVAAAGSLARPFIANAAASTATVWWTQGFVPEEDAAFKKLVVEYQKQSGNTIDFSLIPFAPLNQKTVSALTSGDVPDLIDIDTDVLVPQNAWGDKMVDVSDVVDTQKDAYHPTVYLATQYYNNVAKKRGIYIVPYKTAVVPFHVWNSLVEKAGFKLSDAPKTWDAFWDFFKPMQAKLRDAGMRNIYALGMQCTTTGPNDGNNLFHHFLIANGGNGIVTKDGKVHLDDPQVKEAAIKAIDIHYQGLQGRLRAAGGAELERRRRQQRLPLEAVRDGFRRHDLDRGRDQGPGRARPGHDHGAAARQ